MNINYQTFRIYNLLPFPILIKTGEDLATGTPSQNVKVEPNGIFRAGFNVQPEAVCFQKAKKVFVYVSTDAGEPQIAVLDPGPGETVYLNAEMIDTAHLSDEMKSALTESSRDKWRQQSLSMIQAAESPSGHYYEGQYSPSATVEFVNHLPFPVRIMRRNNKSHSNRLVGGQRYVQHTWVYGDTWDIYLEGIDNYVAGVTLIYGEACNWIIGKGATVVHDYFAITPYYMLLLAGNASRLYTEINNLSLPIDANVILYQSKLDPDSPPSYFTLSKIGEYHGHIKASLTVGYIYIGKGVTSGVTLFYLFVGRQGHPLLSQN